MTYTTLEEMIVATAEAVRPPERITVSEAAERYHIVKNPGQHEGPFSLEKTPYLREPMDVLTSLDYTGMAFAGPARTGKSAMAINWLCHTAITDPADMMVVHMGQTNARDWSLADLAKALRNSPELRKRLVPGKANDNVFDKAFLSGMRLTVTWPTISNLSGKTIPRLWIMDMDRIKPQIIDKEGHVFDLTKKRSGTFKRYGMTAAEASPGFPVTDPKWTADPSHPHEAPPCDGILSIYNRGDRRRWFWKCPQCESAFEPHFKLLKWPTLDTGDIMEMAEQTYMVCPHDGYPMEPHWQRVLNSAGRWVKEGQIWMPNGEITGTARRSDIASFWMFGPAAGFTDWLQLVRQYLTAMESYDKTGDDGPLMTTVTVDQGDAYVPKHLEGGRLPETLKARAEDWGSAREEPTVPPDVRFLMAMVDVQGGVGSCFVVHVFGVDSNRDIWHVDMFKIRKSPERKDEEGESARIDPGAYVEDWETLVDQVMERTYPLSDGSGRRMGLKLTACDSGGSDGATATAYEFWLKLRDRGLTGRFHLLKGVPSKTETAPIRIAYPNAQSKGNKFERYAAVPVWYINSNIVKDNAANLLERTIPGGQIHFPHWAEMWLYAQLTNEIRLPNGQWEKIGGRKNEAWDLLCYALAFLDHRDINIRYLDWDNPPTWAAEWGRNDFVYGAEGQPLTVAPVKRSLADLAGRLA